jgi:glycosyltransferase involved in cell wall biosynthesis
LGHAIGSLKTQSFSDWECIIVDDGSTDETLQLAQALMLADGRVRFLSQQNCGPSAARNRGLEEARGRYVQFLDADDLLEREKLKLHVDHLDQHPGDGIVYSDVRYFPDEDPTNRFYGLSGEEGPWVALIAESQEPILTKLLLGNIMAVNCPLVRKSTLEEVGAFDEAIRGCEDWDYWLRCAAAGIHFAYLSGENGMALVRSHRTSSSRDPVRMREGEYLFRLKAGRFIRDPALRRDNFEAAANSLEKLALAGQTRRLLRLARANATVRVYTYALLRILDRKHRVRTLARWLRAALDSAA